MSQWYGVTITNEFRVLDEEKFSALVSSLYGSEDMEHPYDYARVNNNCKYHSLACYGAFEYIIKDNNEEFEESNIDLFYSQLQEILHPDDVFIQPEVGHEKLSYVTGASIIVSNTDIKVIDIVNDAQDIANQMIKNNNKHSA